MCTRGRGLGQMWPPTREERCPCLCQHCRRWNGRVFSEFLCNGWSQASLNFPKWGSSRVFWKTPTPKSSTTPGFLRPRSPSSSFWILVSVALQGCHLKKRQGREAVALSLLLILSFFIHCISIFDVSEANLLGIYRKSVVQAAVTHYTLLGSELSFQFGVYF